MPFKKGQSGNPKGRPKKGDTFSDIFEKYMSEEELFTFYVKLIKEGDKTAIVNAIDRIFGKPKIKIEHSGDEEQPAKWIIEVRNVGNKKATD
jgi:hypothetical protein